jgi:general secretion pathway protein F
VSVFANTKQKLPFLTIVMLHVSDFVRQDGIYVAILLVGAWFLWRRALRNPELKLRWHTWKLNAPVYGKFERSLNTARFASTLAITTGSGVPILRALDTSRDTLSNVAMRNLVEEATASVREGVSLARALSAQKHFPPMLVHMIRAGEITAGHARARCQFAAGRPRAAHPDHRRPARTDPDPGHGPGGARDRAGRAHANYRN